MCIRDSVHPHHQRLPPVDHRLLVFLQRLQRRRLRPSSRVRPRLMPPIRRLNHHRRAIIVPERARRLQRHRRRRFAVDSRAFAPSFLFVRSNRVAPVRVSRVSRASSRDGAFARRASSSRRAPSCRARASRRRPGRPSVGGSMDDFRRRRRARVISSSAPRACDSRRRRRARVISSSAPRACDFVVGGGSIDGSARSDRSIDRARRRRDRTRRHAARDATADRSIACAPTADRRPTTDARRSTRARIDTGRRWRRRRRRRRRRDRRRDAREDARDDR